MPGFDPKVYRNLKDGVGSPGDPANTDSTSSWTMVALLKGIWSKLNVGITVTGGAQDTTLAASNASLAAIDTKLGTISGNVDGLETLATALNGFVDGLETLDTAISGKLPATLGQKTMSASLAVTMASDQTAVPITVGASAATGGISTTARLPSAAASTNATLVKGSAGRVYCLTGKNNAAYDVWLVLYDSAASPPVPGTTTIRRKVPCPAGQAFVYDFPVGLTFATGIGYAFTKLVADADTTVLVAADITGFNLDYV